MPRWEPDARPRFVRAALELFEERGYEATGVAEIAARAGLTKTTFFRHFPNKREVLSAGQELHSQTLAEAIAAAPVQATPLAAVNAAILALAETFTAEQHDYAPRLNRVIAAAPELQERAALKQAGYVDAMHDALLARGVSDLTAAVAAELGHLAFMTGYERWAEGPDPDALPRLVGEAMSDIHSTSLALT